MIHDRFCINSKGPCCEWLGDCDCQCLCEFINEIREDEREQAVQRVEAICAHTKYEGCPPCSHSEAAAAVRDES